MHLLNVAGWSENCRRGRGEAPRKYRSFVACMPNLGLPRPARGQTRPRDLPVLVHGKTSLRRKGKAYARCANTIWLEGKNEVADFAFIVGNTRGIGPDFRKPFFLAVGAGAIPADNSTRQEFYLESRNDVQGWNS